MFGSVTVSFGSVVAGALRPALAPGEAQDRNGLQDLSDASTPLVQVWSENGISGVGALIPAAAPFGIAVDPYLNRVHVALPGLDQVEVHSTKPPCAVIGTLQ